MMPDLDGFQVIEAVRRSERLQTVPVIVLTAKDLSADERDFLNGRGGVVIPKGPDARQSLLAALGQPQEKAHPEKPFHENRS